jgi:hypothetical protein
MRWSVRAGVSICSAVMLIRDNTQGLVHADNVASTRTLGALKVTYKNYVLNTWLWRKLNSILENQLTVLSCATIRVPSV